MSEVLLAINVQAEGTLLQQANLAGLELSSRKKKINKSQL